MGKFIPPKNTEKLQKGSEKIKLGNKFCVEKL